RGGAPVARAHSTGGGQGGDPRRRHAPAEEALRRRSKAAKNLVCFLIWFVSPRAQRILAPVVSSPL
ncbi:Os04g0121900, partial [Oryza sativa Japonica Group]